MKAKLYISCFNHQAKKVSIDSIFICEIHESSEDLEFKIIKVNTLKYTDSIHNWKSNQKTDYYNTIRGLTVSPQNNHQTLTKNSCKRKKTGLAEAGESK